VASAAAAPAGPAGDWPESPDDFQLAYLTRLAESWRKRSERLYFLYADTFPSPLLSRTGLDRAAWCANVGIREQHLVALAHGIAVSDPAARIIVHTGDAFLLRAVDQLHAALSVGSRMVLLGDDAGLTNCRNGASHQSALAPLVLAGLPALRRREPVDGADLALVLDEALEAGGVTYVRLHDGVPRRRVPVPGPGRSTSSYVARRVTHPDVVVAASGYLVGEALAAAEELAERGVAVEVVAVVDPAAAGAAVVGALAAGVPVLTAYDGHPDVLAAPVRAAAADRPGRTRLRALGFERGTSGRVDELLDHLGLGAAHLAAAAAELAARTDR
jgi:transketolase